MRKLTIAVAVCLALTVCQCTKAQGQTASPAQPQIPVAPPCLEQAASLHKVNPWLVRAIIWHESRNEPALMLANSNGTWDLGLGGINSVHGAELAQYGISPAHLLDPCVNVYVTAWMLQRRVAQFGNTWQAVGAYHSKTTNLAILYATQIHQVLQNWGILPSPPASTK